MRTRRLQRMRWWACVLAAMGTLLASHCGNGENADESPAGQGPLAMEDTETFSGQNAWNHCAALCELGPRPTGSQAYAKQVEYLAEYLSALGWRVQRDTFSPMPGREMTNLRAVFGAEEGVRPILVSCHIDTKGSGEKAILGADDGASGAAALLELARVLARTPEQAKQVELAFFDGEEALGEHITESDGLYGSRYDVARRGEKGLPACMINLDMVGGEGKVIAVPVMDTLPEMYELYRTAVRELGLPEERWTLHLGSYWDDHRPFVEAGVPTLNLIASFAGSRWWHTARDNMQRISAASLEETGKVILRILSKLQTARQTESAHVRCTMYDVRFGQAVGAALHNPAPF